jgi:hypothetical protein
MLLPGLVPSLAGLLLSRVARGCAGSVRYGTRKEERALGECVHGTVRWIRIHRASGCQLFPNNNTLYFFLKKIGPVIDMRVTLFLLDLSLHHIFSLLWFLAGVYIYIMI